MTVQAAPPAGIGHASGPPASEHIDIFDRAFAEIAWTEGELGKKLRKAEWEHVDVNGDHLVSFDECTHWVKRRLTRHCKKAGYPLPSQLADVIWKRYNSRAPPPPSHSGRPRDRPSHEVLTPSRRDRSGTSRATAVRSMTRRTATSTIRNEKRGTQRRSSSHSGSSDMSAGC